MASAGTIPPRTEPGPETAHWPHPAWTATIRKGERPRTEDNPMSNVPDRATFENAYAGKAPWDIGKPQAPFVAVADRVTSPVLDAGCGTGDTALFFAARGHRVIGIDFLDEPIRRARAKAAERGL